MGNNQFDNNFKDTRDGIWLSLYVHESPPSFGNNGMKSAQRFVIESVDFINVRNEVFIPHWNWFNDFNLREMLNCW